MRGQVADDGLSVLQAFPAAALDDLHRASLVVLREEGRNVLLRVIGRMELHFRLKI